MFLEALSIKVIGSLTSDLLKRAAEQTHTPVGSAIAKTVERFPQVEGLKKTLEQWLVSQRAREILEQYAKGLKGFDDIKIEVLAEALTAETQFFPRGESTPTAQEIVSGFLAEIRTQYLKTPELGLPHIANRVEDLARSSAAGLDVLIAGMEDVKDRLSAGSGPSGENTLDSLIDEAKGHLEKYRYDLAEDRSTRLRLHSWDRLSPR